MKPQTYDVIIIGGGPAGSAAGAVLAADGHHVAIVEREKFPRYTVGESMLPFCYFPLERIGVINMMKKSSFTNKHSVQFVRPDGKVSLPFYFAEYLDHEAATTWQVERSEFDRMLLDNAREKGANVFEDTTAKEILKDERGCTIGVGTRNGGGDAREFRAPITIDASGQCTFTASRNGWRTKDRNLRKIAIWAYYKGAVRDSGLDEGATTVAYLDDKNWFWYIPLQNDYVSAGVVGERDYLYTDSRDPHMIFQREVEKNAWIKAHLATGVRTGDYRITGDVSYRSRYCAADGLVLTGDAFAFLDPVFSSGLFLALHGGVLAADAVGAALKAGDVSAAHFVDYGRDLCKSLEIMRKLVYAFYTPDFSFGSLIKRYPDLKSDLTDCLIGNLQRDFEPLFRAMSEFVPIPEALDYGGPLVTHPSVLASSFAPNS